MMNFEQAAQIHYDRHEIYDIGVYCQPNRNLSTFVGGNWYLRNINGYLGRVGCHTISAAVEDYDLQAGLDRQATPDSQAKS